MTAPKLEGFRFTDDLGPAKVVEIHEPAVGLRAIVVIDNVACGPAIGGVRMAPDVSHEECFRLARAMTFKNAAAGLPHGGGKSVLFGDPHAAPAIKERLIRAFACAIADLSEYIPGPDMGTDEQAMAWVHDEIGRSVGLPPELGGIPLDEIGATGFGLSAATEVAAEFCKLDLAGARLAVQGFGSVGQHAARFLSQKGVVLVAVSDSRGTLSSRGGLDVERLIALKAAGGSVLDHDRGEKADGDALIGVDCDIWVPAARPDVLRADNVGRLKARLVVQGANIPATDEAEAILHQRGILSVPDFIANAGGVICASVEYHGGTQAGAMQSIDDRIRINTRACLSASRDGGQLPRQAALQIAEQRVRRAMACRRWSSRR